MSTVKGWSYLDTFNGVRWEFKERERYILARPEDTVPSDSNPDDPHCRVDFDASGNLDFSTFHQNFSGYFGMNEVICTAIRAVV